jgi:hypothetical protein
VFGKLQQRLGIIGAIPVPKYEVVADFLTRTLNVPIEPGNPWMNPEHYRSHALSQIDPWIAAGDVRAFVNQHITQALWQGAHREFDWQNNERSPHA